MSITNNELMLGDWVTSKKWIENPFKLTQINVNEKYYYGITSDGSHVGPFFIEEIKPISITPDILEENEFKYTNNHTLNGADTYLLRYEQNGFDFTITYKLNDWFAVDSYDDRMYRIFEMKTGRWYVHELQHILRLLKIEKEIKLF